MPSIFERFGEALRYGLTSAAANANSPFPLHDSAWDDYQTRLQRYRINEFYYTNTQYDKLNRFIGRLREEGRLYVNTRTIYNPVSRLVGIYADKVYPGIINLDNLRTGAIPIEGDQKIIDALIQLFKWSNWNSEKQLFVRQGEKLGDTFIRIVDDVESRRVILEVLDPQKVRYCKTDSAGNIKEIWIEYIERVEERPALDGSEDRKTRKVREIITGDRVTIYHDDKEVDSYENPFGFVPVTTAKATDEGKQYGVVRWNNSRVKIDETNSQAALLNDQTRKSIIPYIATIGGALEKGALNRTGKTLDEIINIAVPQGGDVKAIVPHVDIGSALNNLISQLDEIREDNPELYLYQLTKMSIAPSGIALENFFDLAVTKILGAQGIYDDAFRRACQMALTIGGMQKYKGFESFDRDSFDRGDLEFKLRERDVFKNVLPPRDRVNFLISSGAPASAVWDELEVSPERQAAWQVEIEKKRQQDMEQARADQEFQAGLKNNAASDIAEGQAGRINTAKVE